MKAIILGGCGIMGSSAARDLIKGDDVEKVIIADRRVYMDNIHETVKTSPKVSFENVDVGDFASLVKLLQGNDIVINCVGPFYRYAIPVMKAALEAKINYIDIMDDYDTTARAFEEMDKPAQEAGLTIGVGFGGDPGFVNLEAAYACQKLDVVEEVNFLWAAALNDPQGAGAWTHFLHCSTGDVPQWLDGKLQYVHAMGGPYLHEFPEPWGRLTLYYIGHPEPITFPRYFKEVKNVTVRGGTYPHDHIESLKTLVKYGFTDEEPIDVAGAMVKPLDFTAQFLVQSKVFKKLVEEYKVSPMDVEVKGKEGNKSVVYTYFGAGGSMAAGTGITVSQCAQMLGVGEITAKGVVAPEGAVDAEAFFRRFAKKNFRLNEKRTVIEEVSF